MGEEVGRAVDERQRTLQPLKSSLEALLGAASTSTALAAFKAAALTLQGAGAEDGAEEAR